MKSHHNFRTLAQSAAPRQNSVLAADPFKSVDPSVAVKIFPFPKLTLGPFLDADSAKKPQVEFLMPDKRYYEQRDNYSLDLGNGATAKMKGPMRVRIRIPL